VFFHVAADARFVRVEVNTLSAHRWSGKWVMQRGKGTPADIIELGRLAEAADGGAP
jgi:hypothetical protein